MTYVSGTVIPVKTAKKEAYTEFAKMTAALFKEQGALAVVDCWGEDVPEGKLTSFPLAVKLEPDETVVFSWLTWPSREACDAGMTAVMEDPRMSTVDLSTTGMDTKRMIFGGFEMLY